MAELRQRRCMRVAIIEQMVLDFCAGRTSFGRLLLLIFDYSWTQHDRRPTGYDDQVGCACSQTGVDSWVDCGI